MPHAIQVENLPRINSCIEINLSEVLSYLITLTRQDTAHTMNIGQELKRARKRKGLTVRALSELGGTSPAAISQIEHGARGVSVERIESLLQKTRSRLLVLPTNALTVSEVSESFRQLFSQGDDQGAFRELISYSDSLRKQEPGVLAALTIIEPETSGNDLYDSALAALVEYWLVKKSLPIPHWLEEIRYVLPERTHLTESVYSRVPDDNEIPSSFIKRNVLFPEVALESV